MFDFSFNDLYAFLLTALGMILAYCGGKSKTRKEDKNDNETQNK